jgi:hypothetical protein
VFFTEGNGENEAGETFLRSELSFCRADINRENRHSGNSDIDRERLACLNPVSVPARSFLQNLNSIEANNTIWREGSEE